MSVQYKTSDGWKNISSSSNEEMLAGYILGLLTLPVILVLVCVWQAIFEV